MKRYKNGGCNGLYLVQYVFLVATLMNSLGALLSPVFSNLDFAALIVVRIVQGLGGVSHQSCLLALYCRQDFGSGSASAFIFPPGSGIGINCNFIKKCKVNLDQLYGFFLSITAGSKIIILRV